AELYLNMQREIDGANLTNKEQHIRLHLVPELGSLPIDKISTFTLKALRKKLLAKGLTQATANRIFATYRHITNSLFEWGKIKSPATMIKLVREDNQREYVLSDIQKRDLLGAAGDDSNSFIQLFIQVGLNTSLRHSEILSLRFDQFDHERKTIRVQVKGGSWRNQPMTPTLARILNHERIMANDPEGWIFPNPNSASGHYQSMKAPFRRAVVAAGLNPALVTPHTMRHTAITDIAETGASDRTVQAFSGHQSKEMVWRYTHARDEKVDEALQKLDEANTNEEQILAFRPKSL
ncbi:MAG: site-specific integrase, partial [Rhodospirillaceae bacterium]|nr:site-specific integrase [Rhodospirillaceae bacterium]